MADLKLTRVQSGASLVKKLRALATRINTPRPLGVELPRRVYLDPDGQKVLAATAKKLGITVDLKGEPRAPQFDYY